MKKILVVTETFFPENFLINDLVEEWKRRGYIVDVLTQWPSYPLGKIYPGYKNKKYVTEQWGSSTIHRFKLVEGYRESKLKKVLNYWTFVCVGSRIARKIGNQYDHIFVHQTGPLTVALPAVAIKKKYGTPLTTWTFDIWPDAVYAYGFPRIQPLKWVLDKILKQVYGNSDNILVSSKQFAPTIQKYVPGKEIQYVPNWLINSKKECCDIDFNPRIFHFTFTGNISVSQNLTNVLLGWEAAKITNATLHIVGDGSSAAALKQLIKERKIPNVVMHGQRPYSQMEDLLEKSDVLILPLIANSGIEKTEPMKLQSYLTAGRPILGIIGGSGREIIETEYLGVCTSPTDIQDIARGFKTIMVFTPQEKEAIRERAHGLLTERFNREKRIAQLTAIIEQPPC